MPLRSLFIIASLLVSILLVGCRADRTGADNNSTSDSPAIAFDDLPEGIGRGFPVGTVDAGASSSFQLAPTKDAPNFSMTLADGRQLELSDLQGKPVMINFWATWCPPCRAEMPEIVKAANQKPDLVVLAINVREDLEDVESFAEEYAMNLPVVLDEDGSIQDLYQVRGMPTSVFIDRSGRVSSIWAGLLDAARLEHQLNQIR